MFAPAMPMYNVSYGGECRVERFFFHYTSEQLKGKWRVYAMPPMREASAPDLAGRARDERNAIKEDN